MIANRSRSDYAVASMFRRWIQLICLAVLLAIVGLRPLIGESFRASGMRMTAALVGASDPWAATTLILDAIIMGAAAVTLVFGRQRRSENRDLLLKIGVGVWLLSVVISTCAATEIRPAINASFNLLAAIALCFTLVGLLDTAWKLRLAVCVVVASASVYAATCMDEYATFDETEARYMQSREAFWAKQGVPLDSPRVHSFEGRMRARETGGFFAHSNLAGGYLVLGGFAALALAAAGWRIRRRRGLAIATALVTAVFIFIGAGLTHSAGSLAGGLVGACVLALRFWRRNWFVRRERVLLVGWMLVLAAIAAAVVIGFVRGGLPGASLDFRWRYWTASLDMFADHWATGVGAENFGDNYLGYKPITSPEEIKNPHNVLVHVATEYGALGLAGVLIMLVGGSIAVTRHVNLAADDQSQTEAQLPPRVWVLWCVGLAFAVFFPRMWLLFSRDPNYLFYMTAMGAIVWCAAFLLNGLSVRGYLARGEMSDLAAAVNCGLLAFLVQETANFALFIPGGRATFFSLVAVSMATGRLSNRDVESNANARAVGLKIGGAALIVALTVWIVAKPIRMEVSLRQARYAVRAGAVVDAIEHYHRAVAIDPWDSAAAAELGRFLAGIAPSTPDPLATFSDAIDQMSVAIERAPLKTTHLRSRMRMFTARGLLGGGRADFVAAVADARKLIELYPARPRSYVDLARVLELTGDQAALSEAIDQLAFARELDEKRLPTEVLRRLTPREKREIDERIEGLRERLKKRD